MTMGKSVYMKSHSMKRFGAYLGLAALAGAILGLIGGVTDWSGGASFASAVIVGTTISMAALRESPLSWLRGPGEERRRTHRSPV
jgi:hypothetical protein